MLAEGGVRVHPYSYIGLATYDYAHDVYRYLSCFGNETHYCGNPERLFDFLCLGNRETRKADEYMLLEPEAEPCTRRGAGKEQTKPVKDWVFVVNRPAGIVQTAKLHKIADTQEGGEESVMSTQEHIRKVIEDMGEDADFTRASWLSVLDYVNVDGGIVTGYFGDVKKFLKNGKLVKVVAVIKSCTANALG
ncbi:hypothetical protein Tco_1369179, partial [Tanacetum coccineum]